VKNYRVLVLTDDMPWGHRSIAKSIYGYLKPREKEVNLQVEFAQVKANIGIGFDAYNFIYKYWPSSNIVAHRLMHNETARQLFREMSVRNLPGLQKMIRWYKPDLIISAYFLHSNSLAKWKETSREWWKLWTVVADPWTINPISYVTGADKHLVYDEIGVNLAPKYGVRKENVLATGWWTREEMYKRYDQRLARKGLGIDDNRPIIFVGGGSLGNNALPKILPALMVVKRPMGIVFNAGTDKLALNMVAEFDKLYRRIRKDSLVKIVNYGWIENMAEVLAGVDIVFGKAGPNFLFDVVAAKKPFVAITHISGQEDGNLEIIRKKKLGWVKEKNGEIGDFMMKYLEKPDKYNEQYRATILEEARNNEKSLEKVWRALTKEMPTKSNSQ
jgi:UDP-N-acetylglucosamine:LPS N-acetylglucosamine transferase